jgi:hypothetical protein
VLRKSKGFIDITKTSKYHNNESDENTEDIETKLLAQTSWSSGEVKEVVDYLLAVIIRIAGKGIPADKTIKFIGRVSESFKGVFWGSHYDEVDYRRVISAMRSPIPQDLVVTLTTISHESLNVPSIGMEREESQSKELQRLQNSFSETFARRYVEAIDFSHRELIQEFCDTVFRVLSSSRNAIKQIFKDYGVCIYDADRLLPVANSLMKKLKSVAQDRLQIEMTDGLSSHSSLDRYLEKLQKRYERARIYQYSDFPFEAFYIPPRLISLELKSAPVKGMVKSEVKTGSPYGHTVSFDKPLIGGINSVVLEEVLKSIEQRHKTRRNHGYVEPQLSSGRNALLQIMHRFGVTEEEISDIAPLVEEEGTIAWTTIFSKPGIKCLMGGAGYGKSLFLQNIVLNYSQLDGVYDTSRYLVVFCDLKAILKAGEQTPVVEFLQHEMLKATGENLPLEFIQQFIDNGRCIVLLDAVDELPSEHREEVMKMLMAFWESENPGNKVCITSRSKDYIPLNERCEVFEISELWRHHIVDYIRKLVALDIFNDEDCADFVNQAGHLADNGFLRSFLILSLLVGIYKGEKTLPSTKLELYDKCVKYVSFNREKGRGERNAEQKSLSFNWKDLDLLMTDDIFATLATLCKPNNSEVSRNQILSALQDSVAYDCGSRREAISAINEFLRFCTERTELFVLGNYPERYRFFHRSFYEYFCAINIAERCSDNGDILTELKAFDGDSEVFELFCAKLMQTNKNKLRGFIEFLLGEIEGGLRNDALDYQLFAVFNLLLRWQQSIGTKTKFFDILCENAEAVATVVSHIDFAVYISEALGGIEISKTDKANFQIKFKEYAIIDVLNNVCRWSIDNPNDKNTATINRYAFFTELYALYCGYQSTGDFVRDLLCDTNVRTQIKSGQSFSNSEKKRIQSNIEKLKHMNRKLQESICAQSLSHSIDSRFSNCPVLNQEEVLT